MNFKNAKLKHFFRFLLLFNLSFLPCLAFKDSTSLKFIKNIGIGASTKGIGLETEMRFLKLKKFNFRIGLVGFQFNKQQNYDLGKTSKIEIFPAIQNLSCYSMVDFQPFKKRVFSLSGGLFYGIIQKYQTGFSSASGLNLGGLEIASDDFGKIDFEISWSKFNPYLGINFRKHLTSKRITFSSDVGVLYLGKPSLNLQYEGFLETTTIDSEIKRIETNMAGYRFYPFISFQFLYNFGIK